ncbi:MAG: hypothetical protein ACRD2N_04620 [Vicinamibacterales bacterium]
MVGDESQAPAFLDQACQRKTPVLTFINYEPIFRPLLEYPLCRRILERYGLPIDKV